MKTQYITSILIAFVSITTFGATNSTVDNDGTPFMSKTFTLNDAGHLFVETSRGGITVSGHDENTVVVDVYVRRKGKFLDPTDDILSEINAVFDLSIEQNATEFRAIAKCVKKTSSWKNISIEFKIKVPHNMATHLNTSGGGVKISDMTGNQNLRTSGGGLRIERITGGINGKTSGGGINVEDSNGNIDIATSGGGIKVANAMGNVKVHTSGGSIQLENINGNAEAKTSGGAIKLNGTMQNIVAHTSGGSIKANIKGAIENIHLKTSGGSIYANIPEGLGVDLNLKGNHVNTQLKNFSGSSKKNEIIGSMNGGGIPVYMHTSGGSVTLNFSEVTLIE